VAFDMKKGWSVLALAALFAAVAFGKSEGQKEEKGGRTERERVKESGQVLKEILDRPTRVSRKAFWTVLSASSFCLRLRRWLSESVPATARGDDVPHRCRLQRSMECTHHDGIEWRKHWFSDRRAGN